MPNAGALVLETDNCRELRAKIFFALAHSRRLRVLEILQGAPDGLSFDKLRESSLIGRTSLGHHIRFLQDAALVDREVQGRHSIYRVTPVAEARLRILLPAAVA